MAAFGDAGRFRYRRCHVQRVYGLLIAAFLENRSALGSGTRTAGEIAAWRVNGKFCCVDCCLWGGVQIIRALVRTPCAYWLTASRIDLPGADVAS